MTQCKPKNLQYPITDAIAKAVTINLPTVVAISLSVRSSDSLVQIYKVTEAYTLTAALGYLIREYAREYNSQYLGGVVGGVIQYSLRSVMLKNLDNPELNGFLGGSNGLAYELARDHVSGGIATSFLVPMVIEGLEAFTNAQFSYCDTGIFKQEELEHPQPSASGSGLLKITVNGFSRMAFKDVNVAATKELVPYIRECITQIVDPSGIERIVKDTATGVVSGIVGAAAANFLYAANIESIHTMVDYIFGYSDEICPS